VYYTLDNGSEINVNLKDTTARDKFETSAEFEGWHSNITTTMNLYAEARYFFVNNPHKFSNTVKDTTSYTMSTADDSNIGTSEPLVEWNYTLYLMRKDQLPNTLNYQIPYPTTIGATPGFELLLAVIAVLVVVLLFRQKKKDKQT